MLTERVLGHYAALGWRSAPDETVGVGPHAFRPDLLLFRGAKKLAVKVHDEPLGAFPIGLFGAQCKKAKVAGLVVCESGPGVLEACENAGLDFMPLENVGAPILLPSLKPKPAPSPVEVPILPPPALAAVEAPELGPRIPLWRWAVVAAIWSAALVAIVYWLTLIS